MSVTAAGAGNVVDGAGHALARRAAAGTATADPAQTGAGRSASAMPVPRVSVVVPTYRRADLLARCLAALLAQDFPCRQFEIIVCDDGPDAGTRDLVRRLAARGAGRGPVLRYVPVTRTQGPAGARNAGWQAARVPVIAFTDDDTIPDAHWLAAGLQVLEAGGADGSAAPDALAGTIEVPLPAVPTDYERDAAGLAQAEFATANCLVRRAILERVGGFEEQYTAAWREDSDLQFAIMAAGGAIRRASAARVLHPVRPAPWGVSLAQQRKSRFEALLYRRHPAQYRARIGRRPWIYYGIVLALLVAASAALLRAWPLAAAAGLVWLGLTGAFCLRRLRATARTPAHIAEMLWTSVCIPPLSVFWRLYGAWQYRVVFL